MGIVKKQLHSVGIPTNTWQNWGDFAGFEFPNVVGFTDTFRIWMITSDGGPDQMRFRKMFKVLFARDPKVLVFDWSCLFHGDGLIERAQLDIVNEWLGRYGETWSYFGVLCKLVNCWRDRPRTVFLLWLAVYGAKV